MRLPAIFVYLLSLSMFSAGCRREAPLASAAPMRAAPRQVILQTDWFPQGEHGGYYQALAKGFYADAGLDVEIWPGGPGSGIKLKVARGDAQFGMLRSDDVMLANSVGLPLVMVAATMQHDPQALMVHADSPVKTFQDLDGRTVIGNIGMVFYSFLQKKYGITIVGRQNTYGLGEFLANPDTIQQCVITNEPFFAEQHGRRVRTLPIAAAGYDCYQVIFTRRELVQSSPEMVRAFVQASIRGWRDYLENDPAPANAVILKRNPEMTPELLQFSRAALRRHHLVDGDKAKGEDIGQLSIPRLEEQMKTLVSLKIMETPVEISKVVTTEFLSPEKR